MSGYGIGVGPVGDNLIGPVGDNLRGYLPEELTDEEFAAMVEESREAIRQHQQKEKENGQR